MPAVNNTEGQLDVLLRKGMFWLERGDYEFALGALIDCHRQGYKRNQIENYIHNKLSSQYQEQHERNYHKNVDLLKTYTYIGEKDYPSFGNLNYIFIPYSEGRFLIYDRAAGEFTFNLDWSNKQDYNYCKPNEICMLIDEFCLDSILECERITRDPQPYLWRKDPLFLYFNAFEQFVEFLQLYDLTSLLDSQRIVFIFGLKELEQYFSDYQAIVPNRLLNISKEDEVVKFFLNNNKYIQEDINHLRKSVNDYYASRNISDSLEKIKQGNPRILFHASRFSTAMQYSIRDCVSACDKLGIPNQVCIEKSDVHRINDRGLLKKIDDFKPDIIFCINHFRWAHGEVPSNIIVITWVQDLLDTITTKESAAMVGPLDFILNAFTSNVNILLDFGYPQEAIISAPILTNHHIYKEYSLESEEFENYCADICAFSNSGNPQTGLDNFLSNLIGSPIYQQLAGLFTLAYREMYEAFYREEFIYSEEEYINFVSGYLKANSIEVTSEGLYVLSKKWRDEVGWRIIRSVPLEWLHERSYNMKIWGKEWVDHPVLKTYAQGVAANGETLSRIINASKIVVGTNPGVTTHPRLFETFLSNSFYLAYRVPDEHDWANIRDYLEESNDIVFAYTREDLYKKLDFYLENEEARRKMIKSARGKIIEKLTFEAFIARILKEVEQKLDKSLTV